MENPETYLNDADDMMNQYHSETNEARRTMCATAALAYATMAQVAIALRNNQ